MLEHIHELAKAVTSGHRLDESMTPEEMRREREELAYPDMRPCDFDVTFEAWLLRIGTWGKVKITHVDPEFKSRDVLSPQKFVDTISDPDMSRAFGQLHIEALAVNKIRLYRDYKGLSGKTFREEFVVEIDLKPELRDKLK